MSECDCLEKSSSARDSMLAIPYFSCGVGGGGRGGAMMTCGIDCGIDCGMLAGNGSPGNVTVGAGWADPKLFMWLL